MEVVVSDLFSISKLTSSHPFQVMCEKGARVRVRVCEVGGLVLGSMYWTRVKYGSKVA